MHVWLFILASPLFWLTACGSNPPAPVRDETSATENIAGEPEYAAAADGLHVVAKGETLYSIAWRYGVDFAALVALNRLSAPYTIYPGQTLRVTATSGRTPDRARVEPRHEAVNPPAPIEAEPAPVSKQRPAIAVAPGQGRWSWPTRGAIVRPFNAKGAGLRGIQIAGNVGQDVVAVAPGSVVYSGNGLAGYGNLIIIKHDRHILSAYGYNRKLWVREGDVVRGRQKIAEMGTTGGSGGILYFEIRRDGKPIDPLTFLSKR